MKNITTLYNIKRFTDQCFDRDNDKVAPIIKGILDARSPKIINESGERISLLLSPGKEEFHRGVYYKAI